MPTGFERLGWIVLAASGCGASEITPQTTQPHALREPPCVSPVVDASFDARDVNDAGSTDASDAEAAADVATVAVVDPRDTADALLARIATLPLKTIPSPPPPPPLPPPPPPHHDLEARHMNAPRVYEASFKISDGLPFEVVRRIIRQNFGRMRLCYENGLRDQTTPAKAKMIVRFAIGKTGEVTYAEPVTSNATPAVTTCYVRGFRGLAFPEPEAPLVVVEYAMSFEP